MWLRGSFICLTRQYIVYAADGRLITILLFIGIIVFAFRAVGRYVRAKEKTETRATLVCAWALGEGFSRTSSNFLSVSYFDQNIVNWYLLLAMISTAAASGLLVKQNAQSPSQTTFAGSEVAVCHSDAIFVDT